MPEPCPPTGVFRWGLDVRRAGVAVIEPRTIIAYGLIILLLIAAAVVIINLHYNSRKRKDERERRRNRQRYRERFPGNGEKEDVDGRAA